jgi:hypothetical protein
MDTHRTSRERGQILVLFALALVAIIGMVGLVLAADRRRRGRPRSSQ